MTPAYVDDAVTLYGGDCLDVLAALPDCSVDAVVTDPPYLLGFMGREWDTRAAADHLSWHGAWSAECLRVLKPGGHLLAFGGTRTFHRLACAVEDAGFEIRDSITWLYGSGFPKSLDVGKAIDKAAGAEREVIGPRVYAGGHVQRSSDDRLAPPIGTFKRTQDRRDDSAPATEAAQRWQGWGTALKPASEPIVVARKPLTGTVAQTVLTHGTGALNIEACRVDGGSRPHRQNAGRDDKAACYGAGKSGSVSLGVTTSGRWPANVVLTHTPDCDGVCVAGCPVAELDQQSGASMSPKPYTRSVAAATGTLGWNPEVAGTEVPGFGDSGGASRFFPTFRYQAKAPASQRPKLADGTAHPTVKPLDLMRWLVRLVTPPGGTVLDPFAGSGTTLEAATLEGFTAVGVERDDAYLAMCRARLAKPVQGGLFGEAVS